MDQSVINESGSYITSMNQSYIQEQMSQYTNNTLDYLEANNLTDATLNDILGYRTIIKEELGMLPASLPYKIIEGMGQYSEVPDDTRHKIKFEIYGNATTLAMAELAGKRITLSYVPATEDDAALIEEYGGITEVPAYLVEMTPVLRVEGEAVAIGAPETLGERQQFVMEFITSGGGRDRVANDVTVGAYYAVGLNVGKVPERLIQEHQANLKVWSHILDMQNYTDDRILGEMLYTTAMAYFYELDIFNEINARANGIFVMRQPSESIVALGMAVTYLFWSPYDLDLAGLNMDVDRNIYVPLSKSGDDEEATRFMLTTGYLGSALEHGIFEQLYNVPSVSAVKILQIANDQGIPIYAINSSNVDEMLPKLQVSDAVKSGIQSAVASGMIVTIPERNIEYYNWTGIGYIVLDPETGAGAYMISGGLAGGSWALLLGCFKEIFEFVKSNLGGYVDQIWNFIERADEIRNSALTKTEDKWAAFTLIGLVLMYGVILAFVYEEVGITVGFLILATMYLIATAVLTTMASLITGKPTPFSSCDALLGRLWV